MDGLIVRDRRDDLALPLLDDILRRRGQDLLSLAYRMGLSAEDAEDAVQEAFARLCAPANLNVVDREAWLFRTVYHLAMDAHRWRRRVGCLRRQIFFARPTEVEGDEPDLLATVWSAVDELPERQRAIVYLRHRMDFTYEVIATMLGITAGAARSQGSVAMATLQRKLRDVDEA